MTLYNEKEITIESVLAMLRETENGADDMTTEEKEIIYAVASQNYEGAEEDLGYLTEKLMSHQQANWQTVYDILSEGDWYYQIRMEAH